MLQPGRLSKRAMFNASALEQNGSFGKKAVNKTKGGTTVPKEIEFRFKLSGETKNNYTFEQDIGDLQPMMFPKKIYLNKKLFKQEPKDGAVLVLKK